MIEFKRTSFVINSEGFLLAFAISTMYFPASRALRSLELSDAGIVEVPGSTRFSTSPSICIVFAVPMDGHAPKDGHTQPSISISSSSDGLDYETGMIFEINNIKPKIRYKLNEDFATLKMVEEGFGITILPKLLLKNAPFDICVRPFKEHYSRVLGVAYAKDAPPTLATMKFLDYVQRWKK